MARPFVVVSSWHGTMIVNRFDYRQNERGVIGVGHQILTNGAFDRDEVNLALTLLKWRLQQVGRPIVAYDLGANIGAHTVKWAQELGEHIQVVAVEAQRMVYYQLCGNIVLNNLLNVDAKNVAVSGEPGMLEFQEPNYNQPGSFGSLELRQTDKSENIGQDLSTNRMHRVDTLPLDALSDLPPDLIKIDVEGMEEEVLSVQKEFLRQHRPIILCEFIKSDRSALEALFTEIGYRFVISGINYLAMPEDDPLWERIKVSD